MSLVQQANELPDGACPSGNTSWCDRLDSQSRKDVLEFIDAYWRGDFATKFGTQRSAAKWLTDQVNQRCKIGVKWKAVEDFMRTRRP